MFNNALFGFMVQSSICKKFGIYPTNERIINTFNSNYDVNLKAYIDKVVDEVFDKVNIIPIKCTTFELDKNGQEIPYNFILSDDSTLSVRTNINGCKVAPRIVGQAGFEKLNYYFKDIYQKKIESQDDIKHLIIEKIDEVLPIFIDKLFDADYILWMFQDKKNDYNFSSELIKGNSIVDIDYNYDNFSFTKNFNEWNESTTLKYKDLSIAEIQVHKNRAFKFRFIMKNLISMIKLAELNNETLGITAEKTVCDVFNIKYPSNFYTRYTPSLQYQLEDVIKEAFLHLPKPIEHSGSSVGCRGGNSKCSYDFILEGNKTLSLKTNIGKMVCPPEIGQPNNTTCYLYFKDLITENKIDENIFKKMVFENIDIMIPRYLKHLFDSDYLLRIYEDKEAVIKEKSPFKFEIIEKNFGINFNWIKSKFSFSKETIEEWNESNTVYYNGISLGEFQVHNNRNCFKFRFNFNNLLKIIRSQN